MLEIRKLNGRTTQHPRWNVPASDASLCTVVVLPFVPKENGRWVVDRKHAGPVLVPLLSLGKHVDVTGHQAQEYTFNAPEQEAGGTCLRAMSLDETMFRADAMLVANSDLANMRVAELKSELQARQEPHSGAKALLQRRLHAAIVRNALSEQEEDEEDM